MSHFGIDIPQGFSNSVSSADWTSSITTALSATRENQSDSSFIESFLLNQISKGPDLELIRNALFNHSNNARSGPRSSSDQLSNDNKTPLEFVQTSANLSDAGYTPQQLLSTMAGSSSGLLLSPVHSILSSSSAPNGNIEYCAGSIPTCSPTISQSTSVIGIATPKPIRSIRHDTIFSNAQTKQEQTSADEDERLRTILDYTASSENGAKAAALDDAGETLISSSISSVIDSVVSGSNDWQNLSQNEPFADSVNLRSSRSFCRPPGHEAPSIDDSVNSNMFVCKVCGFSCTSRFHYNSHMNTHTDRGCPMCNYTTRTEGRLRTHMITSHSLEQRQAAGVEIRPKKNEVLNHVFAAEEVGSSSLLKMCSTNDSNNGVFESVSNGCCSSAPLEQLKALAESQSLTIQPTLAASTTPSQAREHIPKEKQLTCEQCKFVTEYKHHLEYHIRNHYKSKPFECTKCAYTCVNKSMLNSHMKSHVSDYPFRCRDCTYRTKYSHSLKMHLMKYSHRHAGSDDINDSIAFENCQETMDPQGIDSGEDLGSNPVTPAYSSSEQQLLNQVMQQQSQIPTSLEYATTQILIGQKQQQLGQLEPAAADLVRFICPTCNFNANSNEEAIRHLAIHMIQNQQQSAPAPEFQVSEMPFHQQLVIQQLLQQHISTNFLNQQIHFGLGGRQEPSNIDASLLFGISNAEKNLFDSSESLINHLSKIQQLQALGAKGQELGLEEHHYQTEHLGPSPTESKESAECGTSSDSPNSETRRSKRKNSRKVDQISFRLLEKNSPDNSKTSTESHDQEMEIQIGDHSDGSMPFSCQHCMMGFKDKTLYLIHLGYHDFGSPFKCNRCGHISKDSLDFNIHLYQAKHD